jgi:hypothetical protein
MPLVHWPKRKFYHARRPIIIIVIVQLVVASALGGYLFLNSPRALAVGTTLPDPADGSPVTLVVSQNSTGQLLNAPVTWAKFYFNPADVTGQTQVFNMPWNPCTPTADVSYLDFQGPRVTAPCVGYPRNTADNQVLYDFYGSDAAENQGALIFTINGQNGAISTGGAVARPRNAWSGIINIPLAGIPTSLISGYKVVFVRVHFAAGLTGGQFSKLHSFELRTWNAGDVTGYWAQAGALGSGVKPAVGQYAIRPNFGPGVYGQRLGSEEFDFGPPCNWTTGPATIRWFDVDSAVVARMPEFWLYEIDPGGVQTQLAYYDPGTNPSIGGNNIYAEYTFTAKAGYHYRWVWHDIAGAKSATQNANAIQFWIPFDSVNYLLKCAAYNYHSTINAAPGTPPGGSTAAPTPLDLSIPANQSLTFQVNVRNTGNIDGPPAFVDPRNYQVPPGKPAFSAYATLASQSWNAATPIVPTIPAGQTLGDVGNFTYNINTGTPDGTEICFYDHIRPNQINTDPGIDSDPPDQCYRVLNAVRNPAVRGFNGDVHAGGGHCGTALTDGAASGNPNARSFGQYVVSASASGGISGFGSNSGLGSGLALSLGANGGYAQVCRPDIVTYARNNPAAGAATITGAATVSNFDLTTWTNPTQPGGSTVYFYDGAPDGFGNPVLHVSGTVLRKTTIVALSGDIEVDGNILLSNNPAATTDLPSLGLISAGNINISNAAGEVDAYMFADGTIDTCFQGASDVRACASKLIVNGFAMAHALALHRTGPAGTQGTQVAEQFSLTPQLYLNPPTYMDSAIDNSPGLTGENEGRPLF